MPAVLDIHSVPTQGEARIQQPLQDNIGMAAIIK